MLKVAVVCKFTCKKVCVKKAIQNGRTEQLSRLVFSAGTGGGNVDILCFESSLVRKRLCFTIMFKTEKHFGDIDTQLKMTTNKKLKYLKNHFLSSTIVLRPLKEIVVFFNTT